MMDASADLHNAVERFRAWADNLPTPVDQRSGEWECDYDDWPGLYRAALAFVATLRPASWADVDVSDLLFVIARDNELQWVADEIRATRPDLLVPLAKASLVVGEPDARWQLAFELGRIDATPEVESLLLVLAADESEYVRRRSLESLATIRSSATEQLALEAWERADENQQWSRMMALHCLAMVDSPHLERMLEAADADGREHLVAYAARVRRGETD